MAEPVQVYLGANWLKGEMGSNYPISTLGVKVADLIGFVWRGIYHFRDAKKMDWTTNGYLRLRVGSDFLGDGRLLFLTLAARRMGLNVELRPCNFDYIYLYFWDYTKDGFHYVPFSEALQIFEETCYLPRWEGYGNEERPSDNGEGETPEGGVSPDGQ